MKTKTIDTILWVLLIVAGLYIGSSLDKEVLLHECVQECDGSDAECEECYFQVYGEYPNDCEQ